MDDSEFELDEEFRPYFDFDGCVLEMLIDELERADPEIRQRIARISEQLAALRKDPDCECVGEARCVEHFLEELDSE